MKNNRYLTLILALGLAWLGLMMVLVPVAAEEWSPPYLAGTLNTNLPGSQPKAAAVDPVRGYAYIADSGTGSEVVWVMQGITLGLSSFRGTTPAAIAVNPDTGYAYVTRQGADTVVILQGTTEINRVVVGTNSEAVAVLTTTGYVYVALPGANKVAVLSGTQWITECAVGQQPKDIAVNPVTGYVYVANRGSNSVSVLQGTVPVATITDVPTPTRVAVNPATGYVYVSNGLAGIVTVLSGTQKVTTVGVGTNPSKIAVNPATGYVYVINEGKPVDQIVGSVSVLSGTSVIATLTTITHPWTIAANPSTGYIYVGNQNPNLIAVIRGTQVTQWFSLGATPQDIAVDTISNLAYVPLAQGKIAVVGQAYGYGYDLPPGVSGSLVCTGTQGLPLRLEVPADAITLTQVRLLCSPLVEAQTQPYLWAGQAFRLEAYQGEVHLPGFRFARPITVGMAYNEARLQGAPETSLQLRTWQWSQARWTTDGIALVARVPAQNWLTVTLAHLSDYAVVAPPRIFLPLVLRNK